MSSVPRRPSAPSASNNAGAPDDRDTALREQPSADPVDEERSRGRHSERTITLALADLLALVDTAVSVAVSAPDAERQVAIYLEEVQEQLTRWHSRHMALNFEVERLKHRLGESDASAARERQFLIEQQDQFLGSLLDDHERGLEALRADCERAWRKVSELQGGAGFGKVAPCVTSERKLSAQQEVSRDILLRAKQQRDEAQRQTVEALSRLDSAMAEVDQLRALVAPSTLPPGPEIPISMPPEEPLKPAPVPDLARPPSQPTGWRRSVPPVKRDSTSFTGALSAEHNDDIDSREDEASNPSSDTSPIAPAPRLARSDLPTVATAAAMGDSLEAPNESRQLESDDHAEEPSSPARRKPDPLHEAVGGYSITLDGSSPPPGRTRDSQ